MSAKPPLDYDDVAEALAAAATTMGAAECHGFLTGLVCSSGVADQKVWMLEVFEAYDPKDALQSIAFNTLRELYAELQAGLNSPDLDFHLFLPEEPALLSERTEALGVWCQGYLLGLGMGGLPAAEKMSADVGELLDDFSRIANVDFELEDTEEEQVAFEEVAEYLRVGVLVLYEALQPVGELNPGIQ
jgi:yecA family protein